MTTKFVGLDSDHPAFVSRLTLTVGTCLQFFAAGASHGVLSVACTDLAGLQRWCWEAAANYAPSHASQNVMIEILINGWAALKSFSSRTSRHYKIHYGTTQVLLECCFLNYFV